MQSTMIAQSSITIDASPEKIWEALTTPGIIKQYFFGVDTVTDWKVGSLILHRGVWKGEPFEDKGIIVEYDPPRSLVYTHYSPLSGALDTPENYQTVTFTISENNSSTDLTIDNDNNESEEAKVHAEQNWSMVLKSLKELLEK